MSSYKPTGIAAKLVDWLHADPGRMATGAEAAALMGTEARNVAAILQYALKNGALFRSKQGGRAFVYCALPFEGDEPEPVEFAAALWSDGEVALRGASLCDDGSVLLSRDQVDVLRALLRGEILTPNEATA